MQVLYALDTSGRNKGMAMLSAELQNWDDKTNKLYIDNFDFGPRIGLLYHLTEKLYMEGTYYYGVDNIIRDDGPGWTNKIQQFAIGLRYLIWE